MAGKLLGPIPRITFHDGAHGSKAQKSIEKWVTVIDRNDGAGWDSFTQLVDWLGFALGISDKPAKLNDRTNEALYREVNIGDLLLHPYDHLGAFIAERKGNGRWNPTGFYPTPHAVVEMMTRMTFLDDTPLTAKVCDPCLGTGRMLLHASNYSLCLYGMDIDWSVLQVAKINGALYAPWMIWPLPAEVLGVTRAELPPPPPQPLPNDTVPRTPEEKGRRRRLDSRQGNLFEGL
jgi:hypothetical protein